MSAASGLRYPLQRFAFNKKMLPEFLTGQLMRQPRTLMWRMLTRIFPVTRWPNAVAGLNEL